MNIHQLSTDTNTSKIVEYLRNMGSGALFTIKDLRTVKDVSYTSIRTILVNLSTQGVILRVARGIYCLPQLKNGIQLFPSITDILEKISLSDDFKYCPKGAYAEYLIGLRNDIPKTIFCYTTGKVKKINLTNGISIILTPSKRKFSTNNIPKELMIAEGYICDMGIQNINSKQKEYIKAFITNCLKAYNKKTNIPPNLSLILNI